MKIYAGMVSPEKHGVSGTRWMIIEGDLLVVSNLQFYSARIAELKRQGNDIIYVENDTAKQMVKNLT